MVALEQDHVLGLDLVFVDGLVVMMAVMFGVTVAEVVDLPGPGPLDHADFVLV